MYVKKVFLGVLLLGLAAAATIVPAHAHHSFTATYMVDRTVTVDGTVVQFLFRNPHCFVHVLARGPDGKTITWAVEWGSADTLGAANVRPTTLKPGDKVKVTGNPARDESAHRLRMRSIERPADGWKWMGTFG